ncbi:MAG TPA: phosphatase PAP2 family protein [Aquabacterium sp.]|nr:phosphatase PAP2 family protein [Aquabacterium sp.]HQC97274.1 phosphatase PAP2 family protein [Aquabacterium sp.]
MSPDPGLRASAAAWLDMLHQLAAWDQQLAWAIREWTDGWPVVAVHVVASLSHLGDRWVLAAIAVPALAITACRGRTAHAALAGLLLGGQGLVVWLLKALFDRARPPLGVIDPAWVVVRGASMPSGHAAAVVVAVGLLAWLALNAGPARWQQHRRAIIGAALLLALAVGASRVLLGAHFATDVLAGWAFGSAWLAASLALLRRCPARPDASASDAIPPPSWPRPVAGDGQRQTGDAAAAASPLEPGAPAGR